MSEFKVFLGGLILALILAMHNCRVSAHGAQQDRETSILIQGPKDERAEGGILQQGGFDIVQAQNMEEFDNLTTLIEIAKPEEKSSSSEAWRLDAATGLAKCNDLELPRLPQHTKPEHYDLTLSFKNNSERFYGSVRIAFRKELSEPSNEIQDYSASLVAPNQLVLHAGEGLDIRSIWLSSSSQAKRVKILQVCRQGEILKLTLSQELANNFEGHLFVSFSGSLDDSQQSYGVFQASESGDDDTLSVATQLEPIYARRVFPCFDEPRFKATFNLSLFHPQNLTAISNAHTLQQVQVKTSNLVLTRFARTPKMSTYLLAFSIGSYEYIERRIKDGQLLVRVYTRKPLCHAELALDAACASILRMESYTGIPYPLDKLDVVGVQNLRSVAMENWGLITYQENALCNNPGVDDWDGQREVAVTIAHEVAHQWFGNLVTMDWWTELWLNEGFAEHLGYKIAQQIYGKMNFYNEYLDFVLTNGLLEDAANNSHPIHRSSLESSRAIEENFDSIAYSKASAILRMLEDTIGEQRWQSAMQLYLKSHQFSNTNRAHLIAALETLKLDFNIGQFFKSWFDQVGFPLVKVDLRERQLYLEQKRFAKVSTTHSSSDNATWMIPITLTLGNIPAREPTTMSFFMNETSMVFPLPEWFNPQDNGSYIKLNKDFKGFYYVHYSDELFDKLERALRHIDILSTADRFNLLMESGATKSSQVEATERVSKILTWNCANGSTQGGLILNMISSSLEKLIHLGDKVRSICPDLFVPTRRFSISNSSSIEPHDSNGAAAALRLLIKAGDKWTIREALHAYDSRHDKPLDPNLSRAIYTAVVRNGTEARFESLFERYQASPSESDRAKLASALGEAQEEHRLKRVLCWLKKARKENISNALCSMLDSPEGSRFLEHEMETNTESLRNLVESISANDLACRLKALHLNSSKSARANRAMDKSAC